MIVGIGIDEVAIGRIEALIARGGERFLGRIYTDAERAYCRSRARPGESLAARFAAKEAVMKCLGTGWSGGITFREIEVERMDGGAVRARLHGKARQVARRLGIVEVLLSLTHTETTATAFAIAQR